jgi:hypothetical protein
LELSGFFLEPDVPLMVVPPAFDLVAVGLALGAAAPLVGRAAADLAFAVTYVRQIARENNDFSEWVRTRL